jgi:hypothetical protein
MLNVETLRRAKNLVLGFDPAFERDVTTLFGFRVIEHRAPPEPVLQITPDFPYVSDRFRAEWNAWARERFGVKEQPIYILNGNILANPRQVVQLRNFT